MIKLKDKESGEIVAKRKKRKSKFAFHLVEWFKSLSKLTALLLVAVTSVLLAGTITWLSENKPQHKAETSTRETFIETLAPAAQKAYRDYGVLPSVSLAQAILESNWGESLLASKYYNLYGVKATTSQPNVVLETAEFVNETWITINGRFRVYDSWADSVEAHAQLLAYGVDWDPTLYHKVLGARNYKQAAQALQDAGYATDPTYAQKLIQMIEEHQLYQYDKLPSEETTASVRRDS